MFKHIKEKDLLDFIRIHKQVPALVINATAFNPLLNASLLGQLDGFELIENEIKTMSKRGQKKKWQKN